MLELAFDSAEPHYTVQGQTKQQTGANLGIRFGGSEDSILGPGLVLN